MEPRPLNLKALRALYSALDARYKSRALYLVQLCALLGIEPGKTPAENEALILAAVQRLQYAAKNKNIVTFRR